MPVVRGREGKRGSAFFEEGALVTFFLEGAMVISVLGKLWRMRGECCGEKTLWVMGWKYPSLCFIYTTNGK